MNLWDRRIKLALVPALFIFFCGCEDPLSTLGFKNPNKKFDVRYTEIEIPTSVLLVDSVPTYHNYSQLVDDIFRLLVGRIDNNTFGRTEARAFTQYRPAEISRQIAENAIFDSLVIKLRLDYYTAGRQGNAPIRINVHELNDPLDPANLFYGTTSINFNPTPLGQIDFNVEPDVYRAFLEAQKDTVIQLKGKLSSELGSRLLEAAKVRDSTFTQYQYFRTKFNGLVLVPVEAEHVIGLSIASANSKLEMHYHSETDTSRLDFQFDSVIGFTNYISDKGSSPLSGIQIGQDFFPSDNRMYVQGGTGIVTKIDFSKFLSYIDTIPEIVLNSAELVIDDVQRVEGVRVPNKLSIKLINEKNHYRSAKNKRDSLNLLLYRLAHRTSSQYDRVWYDNWDNSYLLGGDDFRGAATLTITGNTYKTFITLFLQRLAEIKDPEKQFKTAIIYATDPVLGKSLNGFTFDRSNIKLRIYYTRPNNL